MVSAAGCNTGYPFGNIRFDIFAFAQQKYGQSKVNILSPITGRLRYLNFDFLIIIISSSRMILHSRTDTATISYELLLQTVLHLGKPFTIQRIP